MLAVTYKSTGRDGVVYLPFKEMVRAKEKANALYKKGKLNVKIVDIEEKILYTPVEQFKL